VIVAYIDAYKHEFGVEPICRVLTDHEIQIAPSTYYAAKARPPSRRSLDDAKLLKAIHRVHVDSRGLYGVRKVWKALEREGIEVGRDRVARLMRTADLRGVTRRASRTPRSKPVELAIRPEDLVKRAWSRGAPDRVWIADFTHVKTKAGWAYTSFLQDGETLELLGFVVSREKSTALVTKAIDQAVSIRKRSNPSFSSEGVIHHSDAGSQYTSLAFSQNLEKHGLRGSIGRVGTAHDNALMESTIGLYKTECVHARWEGFKNITELEQATLEWVTWFNTTRLHSSLDYRTPAEAYRAYTHFTQRELAA